MFVVSQVVPMYEAQLEKDWHYIIKDSGSKLLLVANEKIYQRSLKFLDDSSLNLKSIISFDSDPSYLHSYQRWMTVVQAEPAISAFKVVDPDNHLATIIYTSGTTG